MDLRPLPIFTLIINSDTWYVLQFMSCVQSGVVEGLNFSRQGYNVYSLTFVSLKVHEEFNAVIAHRLRLQLRSTRVTSRKV